MESSKTRKADHGFFLSMVQVASAVRLDPFKIRRQKSQNKGVEVVMTESIAKLRAEKLAAHQSKTTKSSGRLQVRVGVETEDLVSQLAILLGCKRAEVVQLAIREFAGRIHPALLPA